MSHSEPFSGRPDVCKQILTFFFRRRNILWNLSRKGRRHRGGPDRFPLFATGQGLFLPGCRRHAGLGKQKKSAKDVTARKIGAAFAYRWGDAGGRANARCVTAIRQVAGANLAYRFLKITI